MKHKKNKQEKSNLFFKIWILVIIVLFIKYFNKSKKDQPPLTSPIVVNTKLEDGIYKSTIKNKTQNSIELIFSDIPEGTTLQGDPLLKTITLSSDGSLKLETPSKIDPEGNNITQDLVFEYRILSVRTLGAPGVSAKLRQRVSLSDSIEVDYGPQNLNNKTIKEAVNKWIKNPKSPEFTDSGNKVNGERKYWGHIKYWDTSQVTDMSKLFEKKTTFDDDIGNWDTSKVTDMSYMFFNAYKFNQDISRWDTSSVTDMSYMFRGAKVFNQDISTKEVTVNGTTYTAWVTSSVTTMEGMFFNAYKFYQPKIRKWTVNPKTELDWMLFRCGREWRNRYNKVPGYVSSGKSISWYFFNQLECI